MRVYLVQASLREKCLYSEFFWSVFSRIRTEYGEIQSIGNAKCPNAGKYGPEKPRIRILFTQCLYCIPYDLTIAKLEVYGFQMDVLKLVHDYLSNRKQRVNLMNHLNHGKT